MSDTSNKTKVGLFVIGGIGLLILAIAVLGNDTLFNDDLEYVMYFDGSVSGLSNGAPVVFRGVPLGYVTKINLVAKPNEQNVTIPVHARIQGKSIVSMNKNFTLTDSMREELIHHMIQRGLRARLQLQSLITGQYRIELDFFPDTPARYQSQNREMEIPTIPSPLDELQRTLTSLPITSIADSMNKILLSLEKIVSNPDIGKTLAAARETFEGTAQLSKEMKPLREDLQRIINTADIQLPEAVAAFQLAMSSIAATADQLTKTITSAKGIIAQDSRTIRELQRALEEFTNATRAVRSLANMLERHPEALLRGKGGK